MATYAKSLGQERASSKNRNLKLKAYQGSWAISRTKMMILIATGIDPLTRGTNLFEHVSCYFLSIMDISVKPNASCSWPKRRGKHSFIYCRAEGGGGKTDDFPVGK